MGVDLVAIMDHDYTAATITRLLPDLRRLRSCFIPFLEMMRKEMHWKRISDDAEWFWEKNRKYRNVTDQFAAADEMNELEIDLHERARLRVYPRTMVYYGTKFWSLFCCKEYDFFSVQLRKSLRPIALAMNSKSIIYAPDSSSITAVAWDYAMDGDTVAQIEMKLRNECGPPVADPCEKCRCPDDNSYCSGYDCWFLENLENVAST